MVFIVITSIIQGPPGPYVHTAFFGTEETARDSYQKSVEDLGDDHFTVVLIKLDTTTLEETTLEHTVGGVFSIGGVHTQSDNDDFTSPA
jgi:hypothetical protein